VNIYKPSELKAFLLENNKKANKKLSQNFLIDKNILDKIVKLNQDYKAFPVLEIGPGPGFKVSAVELDSQFAELLKKRLSPFFPHFKIHNSDFLDLDITSLSCQSTLWSVIANLPYHITSKALTKLIIHSKFFTSLTLMVQKEFYDRIQALDGKDYGILNILIRVCSSSISGFKVSASCFYPAPRVDSAVLHITLNCAHSPHKIEEFHEFLKICFMSRRKKLISNLSSKYDQVILIKAFDLYKLDLGTRVETISPDLYFQLFSFLSA
jgi:16S rRNA (adenine1518-N6/adenine1519-N6)-dimethyltransferase